MRWPLRLAQGAAAWLADLRGRLRDPRAALSAGAVAAIAAFAIVHSRKYAGATIDDAFITFRYAWNLVHGNGFTFNPGERVEGTSSPLFVFLMALPIGLGANPHRVAAFLGTGAFAGCCLVAYRTVRDCIRDGSSRLLALGTAVIVAASSPLAFHSQTGMETLVYDLLLATSFWLFLRTVMNDGHSTSWAVVMGVTALTRPEGVAFFLGFLALARLARLGKPQPWADTRRELASFAMVFGPWLLFRLAYFGSLLPNSVIAKSGSLGRLVHLGSVETGKGLLEDPGIVLVRAFVDQHAVGLALLVGTLLLGQLAGVGAAIIGIVLGYGAVVIWNGGDWMPYDRLFTACITPMAVGSVLGLRGFFFHEAQRTRWGHLPSWVLSALALGFVVFKSWTPLDVAKVNFVDLTRMREMGRRLARVTRRDDVVATDIVGILPYYWGARVLDMYGLCDPHIARSGRPILLGTGRFDPGYVGARRPTMYAFNFADLAATFYREPAFAPYRDEYYLIRFPYGYLRELMTAPPTLFVRKDRPGVSDMAKALGASLVDAGEELRRTGFLPAR